MLLCQENGITAAGAQPIFTVDVKAEKGGPIAYCEKWAKAPPSTWISPVTTSRIWRRRKPWRRSYRTILQRAGFSAPKVAVSDANKQPVLCQVLRHQRPGEQTLLLGLLQRESLPASAPLTVTLPEARHLYDLLNGTYLGHAAAFPVKLTPGYGQLFAALPYRVTGVRVSAPATVTPGQSPALRCEVLVDHGAPEYHVLRLTVTAPNGAAAGYYTQNLEAPHGQCSIQLPIALNAPRGKWQAQVRDVLSGVTKTVEFTVP